MEDHQLLNGAEGRGNQDLRGPQVSGWGASAREKGPGPHGLLGGSGEAGRRGESVTGCDGKRLLALRFGGVFFTDLFLFDGEALFAEFGVLGAFGFDGFAEGVGFGEEGAASGGGGVAGEAFIDDGAEAFLGDAVGLHLEFADLGGEFDFLFVDGVDLAFGGVGEVGWGEGFLGFFFDLACERFVAAIGDVVERVFFDPAIGEVIGEDAFDAAVVLDADEALAEFADAGGFEDFAGGESDFREGLLFGVDADFFDGGFEGFDSGFPVGVEGGEFVAESADFLFEFDGVFDFGLFGESAEGLEFFGEEFDITFPLDEIAFDGAEFGFGAGVFFGAFIAVPEVEGAAAEEQHDEESADAREVHGIRWGREGQLGLVSARVSRLAASPVLRVAIFS